LELLEDYMKPLGLTQNSLASRDGAARPRSAQPLREDDCGWAEAKVIGGMAMPKGLRHGLAVVCISANIPLSTIKRWLGQPRVQALMAMLVAFCFQAEGFRNKQLRPLLAQYLGLQPEQITQGRTSYDLRRLRLHGLI